ncbi:MAG TPA: 50S ribosomal protein L31 [Atopobiaceae bacterium]|nr:50S ribosomal protein L31 [Atopobiaceae bacterium]
MKQGIHPPYMECVVRCSCGNTWVTRATKPEMRLDLCDKCHPFYTGTQKLVDTGGRVQRFADKFGSAAQARLDAAAAAKAAEKARRAAEFDKRAAEAPVEEAPAEEVSEVKEEAAE